MKQYKRGLLDSVNIIYLEIQLSYRNTRSFKSRSTTNICEISITDAQITVKVKIMRILPTTRTLAGGTLPM
jgi:hypothetical protein